MIAFSREGEGMKREFQELKCSQLPVRCNQVNHSLSTKQLISKMFNRGSEVTGNRR